MQKSCTDIQMDKLTLYHSCKLTWLDVNRKQIPKQPEVLCIIWVLM